MRLLTSLLVIIVVATAASCSSDESTPTDAIGADTGASTGVTEAAASSETGLARHDAALATIDEVIAILDDPEAFGTEEEVADLIATHAVPGAMMDDAVFGAVDYRTGFYNTLYRGAMDAEIEVFHRVVSDDGSLGVILWRWHGTNAAGNAFDLPGISLTEFDEQGRITYELVTYPYSDEYVQEAVFGAGTPITVDAMSASPESWDPVLRSTEASTVPEAAVCPADADPDAPGRSEEHPTKAPPSNQGAVFDTALARIVYVDGHGETWTFDVCSNTWTSVKADDTEWQRALDKRLDPNGGLISPPGNLVYDVDSTKTVALGNLGAYDAASNAWNGIDRTWVHGGDLGYRGAVYDPVSGLIVVAGSTNDRERRLDLFAYDVDSDTWTAVGTIDTDRSWLFLVGYSSTTDELILHGPHGDDDGGLAGAMTVLVDPTTGMATSIADPDWDVFAPWGYWYPYAAGVDGAVVVDTSTQSPHGTGDLCMFDPQKRTWDCAIDTMGPFRTADTAAKVYDPVNDRLVVIYPDGDVWAVTTDTGEWIELTESG